MALMAGCVAGPEHRPDAGFSDAGSADAGLSDAGLSDAGIDAGFFGASRCEGSGLTLCEDFENGAALDGGTWTRSVSQGSLQVDSIHAARGLSALHVHVLNAAGNHANLMNTSLFSGKGWPGNHFFGRTFFWLEPAATAMHNGFVTAKGSLYAPDGGISSETAVYGVHETLGNFVTHYSNSSPPGAGGCDCGVKSQEPIPVARWACLEWEFNGPASTTHFWVDEREVPSADITPALPYVAPRFENLTVGFTMYHASTDGTVAYDLWYDGFALDSSRIGCTR